MIDDEVFEKFLMDEEFDLENAPREEYSFRAGWNVGMKRAAILLASEIRPQGEWIIVKDEKYGDNVKCPFCGKELAGTDLNFCCKCGAKLIGSEKMNGGVENG